jgi:hypothetical protein
MQKSPCLSEGMLIPLKSEDAFCEDGLNER